MKTADKLSAWISLWRVSGVGSKTFQKLLDTFSDPADIFTSSTETLKKSGVSEKIILSIQEDKSLESAIPDIEWLSNSDSHHIITIQCAEYPVLLKQISNPPPLLYISGNLSILNDPQLAIVGSRNPSQGGLANSYEFSKYLGKSGFCITSGLALGIDGSAHKGALAANAPTIAIVATGLDRIYPAKHRDLAHQIVEQGAIISEFPIGTQARQENFPRRNRIISGIAHGTLVVEAAKRSGSLITARLAIEQNREVFAIPGSIHNPLARGCHQLIRQGAKLVETAQDILEEMTSIIDINDINKHSKQPQTDQTSSNDELLIEASSEADSISHIDTEHNQLLEKMGYDPVSIDELVIRTEQSPESISAMLLMLELQNLIAANGGGTYTRLK